MEEYRSPKKFYYCGKDLVKYHTEKSVVYAILSFDNSGVVFAEVMSDAEIRVLYKDDAWIDNHHKNGGYSAARFGRIRQEQIKQWHRKLVDYLKGYGKEFYLDASFINASLLEKEMHTYTKTVYKGRVSSGYSGTITGIYQSVKLLDNSKV